MGDVNVVVWLGRGCGILVGGGCSLCRIDIEITVSLGEVVLELLHHLDVSTLVGYTKHRDS